MKIVIQNWTNNKYVAPYPVAPTATLATLKWMPGDSVAEDGRVLHRTVTKLVGIIDVLNHTRFGTTSRGVPFYMMYPIDISYPPFLVAMKSKPETNIFAVVKYEHWLPGSPWPRASFIKSLGPVGDIKSELDAILQILPPLPVAAVQTVPLLDVEPWDVVLHIDPPGCQDIDDILCWKYIDTEHVIFGIGIADASYWIPEDSPWDRIAKERGATLYKDGAAIEPMLPTEISAGCASLKCDGIARPAICLTFDLVLDSTGLWRLADCGGHGTWKQSNLVVNESYTYESIYEKHERVSQIRNFLSAICGTTIGIDSHEWIERAMILYNKRAAEKLQHAGVGILRSHSGMTNEQFAELAVETGCNEIAWLGSASGQYVDTSENTGHAGLSLAIYTHASSPLRRYVDLVNQRWIKTLTFGAPTPTIHLMAAELNAAAKRIRRLERDLHFISMITSCDSELPYADGFLLAKRTRPGTETWTTYVPTWKRSVPCILSGGFCGRAGLRVLVRMFLDTRQADWNRRYIYQGTV